MDNKLPGTWVFEPKYGKSDDSMITTTVAPDHSYVCTITLPSRKIGPPIIRQEGTWRIENGFLIDELMKESQTNTSVPQTNRSRIIRIDDQELELDQEKIPGIVYPTNQIILRRQKK
jgi:hypothetical protein